MKSNYKISLTLFLLILTFCTILSQTVNPKIKCYFNKPVNTAVSSGQNAVYLSGSGSLKDTLIAYINRAKYTIDLCVYNFYNTGSTDNILSIATAINNAYTRGVSIRWIGDGSATNNSFSYLNSSINTIVSPTTTSYGICHNKFLVFDVNSTNVNDAYVWSGSFNFSSQQNTTDYNNAVVIQDKVLSLAYYNEFNKMWGTTALAPNLTNSKFGTFKTASSVTSFTVNGTPIELYFSPKDGAQSKMLNLINSASTDLFFGIYAFTDNLIATSINSRKSAGVNVRGIMDPFSNGYSPISTLSVTMGASLRIDNLTGLYHNKIMLADALIANSDPQVAVGSYNWTSSATNTNDENLLIIHDQVIANQYYQSLCKNFVDEGGVACTTFVGIEILDNNSHNIAVYPNPATDKINVQLKNYSQNLKIVVTNNLGQIILTEQLTNTDNLTTNVTNLNSGVYFVTIYTDNQKFVQKFVKL